MTFEHTIRFRRLGLTAGAVLMAVVALTPLDRVAADMRDDPLQAPAASSVLRWFKGNIHTHTDVSDGDSAPDDVVRWYKERRYSFLVLTDHQVRARVDELNATHGVADKFLLISGEEVTGAVGGKSVHVNGLNIRSTVGELPPTTSVVGALQQSVDAVRRQGGVPVINHPNFEWALTAAQLRQVKKNTLFEVYSGHPQVNNLGGGGVPGLEAVWDEVLTAGVMLYGVAVDDAHHFRRPWNTELALPGRGWIMVHAAALEPRLIVEAIERGDFYSSTGVFLKTIEVTPTAMTITVSKDVFSKYRIQFIGRGGVVLHEALDSPATYEFTGTEGYVRARVLESNGRMAWIQPVLVGLR